MCLVVFIWQFDNIWVLELPIMSVPVVVENELLWYAQNNVDKHPCTLVGMAINGFYTDEEVSAPKQCLY